MVFPALSINIRQLSLQQEHQGDTDHAQTPLVTEIDPHLNHEDRRHLAQKTRHSFFNINRQRKNAADETAQALELLQKNPDLAKLLVAAMGKSTS
jgi:hypothetical protein